MRIRVGESKRESRAELELNCDNAAVFRDEAGVPVFAVIIEIQRGQDDRKRYSWPMYVTILRARLKCPVRPLAVCTDAATADWARRAVEIGIPGDPCRKARAQGRTAG